LASLPHQQKKKKKISELKQKLDEVHKLGAPATQKLIYSGKILTDDQTVGELNMTEASFIVFMISKVAAAPAPAPAPAAAAAAAAAAPAAAPASPVKPAAATQAATAPAPVAAPTAPVAAPSQPVAFNSDPSFGTTSFSCLINWPSVFQK